MKSFYKFCVGIAILLAIVAAVIFQSAHKLENQNMAVVQSMVGDVTARRESGWWIQISPTIWEYPKAGVYSLNGKDGDTLKI